jgi:hypothetical protein
MTRLKYVCWIAPTMSSSHKGWAKDPGYSQHVEFSEEMCAAIEGLVTRIELASAMAGNPDVAAGDRTEFERARDELMAKLSFRAGLLKSSLMRLAEERTQSEKTVSFLERELGKERALLEIEKASNESKEEEYKIQLGMSSLEKELKMQQSKVRTIGDAIGLFQPVLDKATAKAVESAPVK